MKRLSTSEIASALSATRRDATHPNTEDTPERGRGRPPGDHPSWRKSTETTREVKTDPQVADFMKQHNILAGHAIELMGNYYCHNNAAITWEQTAEEESVETINLDF